MACELVGTQLARWFGLPTLDWSILELTGEDEIPLKRGPAKPGPAFVTRAVHRVDWGGKADELDRVENSDAISMLVVFDTWTLNCDRHCDFRPANYDNVFLSGEGASRGHLKMLAADHTHCFTCGQDLTGRLATINRVKDDRVYGLYPAFRTFLDRDVIKLAASRLLQADEPTVRQFVDMIPSRWEVSHNARKALVELVCGRARHLADRIVDMLEPFVYSRNLFGDERKNEP